MMLDKLKTWMEHKRLSQASDDVKMMVLMDEHGPMFVPLIEMLKRSNVSKFLR